MKINSFEVVPSVYHAPATKKQPNNRKAKQQQQKKQTKNKLKNKTLRGLNNLI